ncbi:MAG: hypothetical protein ACOY5F_21945 [Pseudomonadota bacterium]
MSILDWFKRTPQVERRSVGSGYTAEILRMREAHISGRTGLGELTGTVATCTALWERGFMIADVTGTDLLDRRTMAAIGRALAVRGEFVGLIREDRIVSASDWDCRTRDGIPVAYRLSVPEAGGGVSLTALAGEVVHIRINADPAAPWLGVSPLRCASLSANLLRAVETALGEAFENMPLGSQIVPFPETPETDMTTIGRSFRGQRGRVLLRESVVVSAAGGPAPQSDWRPADLTPDLEKALPVATLEAARSSIAMAYGVNVGMFSPDLQGPASREHQRFLATWTLQPVAELIAEEASQKLGSDVKIDVHRPLQSFDAGGSARAVSTLVEAAAKAKEAGLDPAIVAAAYRRMDWQDS